GPLPRAPSPRAEASDRSAPYPTATSHATLALFSASAPRCARYGHEAPVEPRRVQSRRGHARFCRSVHLDESVAMGELSGGIALQLHGKNTSVLGACSSEHVLRCRGRQITHLQLCAQVCSFAGEAPAKCGGAQCARI